MNHIKLGFWPLIFLFCLTLQVQAQIPQQKVETRAVWLTTLNGLDWPRQKANSPDGINRQKQELLRILDKYQELHLNTVLIQTRVRGSMIYPSDYEGWDPALTSTPGKNPGYDPLQFAIEECHKRGMELHCWMVTIPLGAVKVHRALGSKSVTKTHPELCKKIHDNWYLDPGEPGTAAYLATLCEEMTRRYDIDGIHFDFIRYPENSADVLDRNSYKKYGHGQDRAQWRRNNITACVRAMYAAVKSIKPWVKVTSAPLGKYRDTDRFSSTGWNGYNKVYQEAQAWMQEGIMDAVYPMLYYQGNHFYPFVHDWIEHANGRPVIPGLGIYFLHPSEGHWTLADVQRQMNYCRSLGLGVAHYRSKFLTNNTKGLYDWCRRYYYPYPTLTAEVPAQGTRAPVAPQQLQITEGTGVNTLRWDAVKDQQLDTYVTYNVYRSLSPVVNTNLPENLVAARLLEPTYTDHTDGLQYHYAVTAMSRMGLESLPLQSVSAPQSTGSQVEVQGGEVIIHSAQNGKSLQISSLTGQLLMEVPFCERVNIATLKPGSYQVFLITENGAKKHLGIVFK